jgi:hypothetical protein
MKLNNVRQIRAEDFEEDLQQPMGQLGAILNSFMQEVVELADGRIDFENLSAEIKDVEFTVNAEGKPLLNDKISTNVPRSRGVIVINAFNLTKASDSVSGAVFMPTQNSSSGVIQVNKITGLIANNKYRLTILIY